jgi:hypothetical protein
LIGHQDSLFMLVMHRSDFRSSGQRALHQASTK